MSRIKVVAASLQSISTVKARPAHPNSPFQTPYGRTPVRRVSHMLIKNPKQNCLLILNIIKVQQFRCISVSLGQWRH